jgi:hypothetical protein
MTALERALGYKPESLQDFVMARLLYSVCKHFVMGDPDPEVTARNHIKHWDNEGLLDAISEALRDMKEAQT